MLRISQEALTFDDVLLIPGYSEVLPKDVSLKTRLTRGIELNIPLVSAAMDTVTEARLAIAMAQEGGIGIIHKNMGIEQQAAEVRKVKKHETAIVRDPVTVTPSTKIIELLQMAREYGFSGFPVVEQGELVGIVTGRDLRVKPNAGDTVAAIMTPKDKLVTAREGTPLEEMKAKLYENRIEKMLVVDENFYLRKQTFPDVQVIGGNIATAEAAKALAEAGADAVKVGIGPGSICTTRIVAGVGVPQISAIANVAAALEGTGVPLIADGGIRFSGDLAKAMVAGAYCVMMGSMFAGTEEAPGEIELFQGRSYKSYRGMGSLGAMSGSQGSSDRYFQDASAGAEKLVPEGIEGRVPYKGALSAIVHQLMGGLRAAMGYTGSADIQQMRTQPQFVRITGAGMAESHVHDVQITKEAPNYRVG
ncbi:IMP dehydrogenase [Pseudomonas aeruginosa]|uniref:IMP dehydrogenase n=1 Tax=Pseudomonas aeruginosa TaxID=287 RepID=UPI00104D64E9|nr:IMP dehydrogenase [Pseudomonas aeruginosa]